MINFSRNFAFLYKKEIVYFLKLCNGMAEMASAYDKAVVFDAMEKLAE